MNPGLMGLFQGIPKILGGLSQMSAGQDAAQQGAQMAVQGANMQAAAFRNAGVASMQAANYNVAVNRLNLQRQLGTMSTDIGRFVSSQRAAASTSGLKGTSKSFLSVMNDTMDTFDDTVVDLRNSAAQQRDVILFEGKAAEVNFENQARSAQFQGQMAAFQASQQSNAASSGGIGDIFGQLGGLFGGFK